MVMTSPADLGDVLGSGPRRSASTGLAPPLATRLVRVREPIRRDLFADNLRQCDALLHHLVPVVAVRRVAKVLVEHAAALIRPIPPSEKMNLKSGTLSGVMHRRKVNEKIAKFS